MVLLERIKTFKKFEKIALKNKVSNAQIRDVRDYLSTLNLDTLKNIYNEDRFDNFRRIISDVYAEKEYPKASTAMGAVIREQGIDDIRTFDTLYRNLESTVGGDKINDDLIIAFFGLVRNGSLKSSNIANTKSIIYNPNIYSGDKENNLFKLKTMVFLSNPRNVSRYGDASKLDVDSLLTKSAREIREILDNWQETTDSSNKDFNDLLKDNSVSVKQAPTYLSDIVKRNQSAVKAPVKTLKYITDLFNSGDRDKIRRFLESDIYGDYKNEVDIVKSIYRLVQQEAPSSNKESQINGVKAAVGFIRMTNKDNSRKFDWSKFYKAIVNKYGGSDSSKLQSDLESGKYQDALTKILKNKYPSDLTLKDTVEDLDKRLRNMFGAQSSDELKRFAKELSTKHQIPEEQALELAKRYYKDGASVEDFWNAMLSDS